MEIKAIYSKFNVISCAEPEGRVLTQEEALVMAESMLEKELVAVYSSEEEFFDDALSTELNDPLEIEQIKSTSTSQLDVKEPCPTSTSTRSPGKVSPPNLLDVEQLSSISTTFVPAGTPESRRTTRPQ